MEGTASVGKSDVGGWARLGSAGAQKSRGGLPNEVGAPETGIRRNCDLLTPQADHLMPGT
jgi:hypothetical protein